MVVASLYGRWVEDPELTSDLLPVRRPITASEIECLEAWSKLHQEAGLTARVGGSITAQAVEVYGPDGVVPQLIIYPSEASGFIVDEYDTTQSRASSLGDALETFHRR